MRADLERLKKIRSHRGLRHHWGLKVRGQHTCTTYVYLVVAVGTYADLTAVDEERPSLPRRSNRWIWFSSLVMCRLFRCCDARLSQIAAVGPLLVASWLSAENIVGGRVPLTWR
jgi:hypothetical protein